MTDLSGLLHVCQVGQCHLLPKWLEPHDRALCLLETADKDNGRDHGIAIGGKVLEV